MEDQRVGGRGIAILFL